MRFLVPILFITQVSFAQFTLKLEATVTRIGAVQSFNISRKESVLLVFDKRNVGVITTLDTLELYYCNLVGNYYVYYNKRDDHKYSVLYIMNKGKIAIFIAPLRPYRRNVYSLNIIL
jgi:hypothetical protein